MPLRSNARMLVDRRLSHGRRLMLSRSDLGVCAFSRVSLLLVQGLLVVVWLDGLGLLLVLCSIALSHMLHVLGSPFV